MTNNEKKILIIAICAVVLIGIAATLFTAPSTDARRGNGQGKVIASESCGAESDCSVGFQHRDSYGEEESTEHPEDCSGDCDNCGEGERSYKNRTPDKDAAASGGQGIGQRDGRGCGQSGSASYDH